jgi:hypothetical protein
MSQPTSISFRALCAELLQAIDDDVVDVADGPRFQAVVDRTRAELAQPEPEPPKPGDSEIDEEVVSLIPWLLEKAVQAADADQSYAAGKLTLAAQLLGERHPAAQREPEPIAERPWEREGWCDDNGWCWGFDADDTDPCWVFDKPESWSCWTHSLPHNALPLPTPLEMNP